MLTIAKTMLSELPVESVNGQSEWDWNERRAAGEASQPPDRGADRRSGRSGEDGSPGRAGPSRRDVERLEAELERKDQQLRRVTEQYERLLAEKNRQLSGRDTPNDERKRRSALRSVVSRYVVGDR